MHVLLCDTVDSGKSTCCAHLVRTLAAAGVRVDGWITPAHIEHGCKAGHDFVAIECGRMAAPMPFTRREAFAGSFPVRGLWIGDRGSEKPCPFHFNAEAFERAAALADNALRTGERAPENGERRTESRGRLQMTDCGLQIADDEPPITDLFVIDEIGPLELALRRGFHAQMIAALAAAPSTLTVIRTEMRELFLEANRACRFDVYSLATASALEQALLTPPRPEKIDGE